jgi:hypothetical protein
LPPAPAPELDDGFDIMTPAIAGGVGVLIGLLLAGLLAK